MTFPNAISYLTDGQAAKYATWAGYIKSQAQMTTGANPAPTGKYVLTFVKRAATATSGSALMSVVYDPAATTEAGRFTTVNAGTGTNVVSFSDPQLITALAGTNWIIGAEADFEAQRSGTGNNW